MIWSAEIYCRHISPFNFKGGFSTESCQWIYQPERCLQFQPKGYKETLKPRPGSIWITVNPVAFILPSFERATMCNPECESNVQSTPRKVLPQVHNYYSKKAFSSSRRQATIPESLYAKVTSVFIMWSHNMSNNTSSTCEQTVCNGITNAASHLAFQNLSSLQDSPVLNVRTEVTKYAKMDVRKWSPFFSV